MMMMMMMMRKPATLRGREEGAVLVEAALVMPVLLSLMLGIVEFGFVYYQTHAMLRAVSYAGREVMVSYGARIVPGNVLCDTSCAKSTIETLAPFATGSATLANCGTISGMQLTATSNSTLSLIVPVTVPSVSICVPLV